MFLRPVHVDSAFTHGLKRTLHADRADVNMAEHGGNEKHSDDAVDDLGPLHASHVGCVEREHQFDVLSGLLFSVVGICCSLLLMLVIPPWPRADLIAHLYSIPVTAYLFRAMLLSIGVKIPF